MGKEPLEPMAGKEMNDKIAHRLVCKSMAVQMTLIQEKDCVGR